MIDILQELDKIENEHKDFFDKNNLKPHQYITLSKRPVMIRFNEKMDIKHRLPKEAYERVTKLVMSYYDM